MVVDVAPSALELERITVLRRSWASRLRSPDVLIGLVTALFGAVMVAVRIGRAPSFAGDEGIYVEQAWSVGHGQIVPYTYTYDHPFLGWVQLSPLLKVAEWLHIGGSETVLSARAVMVLYAFATLLLTYALARRMRIRIPYAALAVLLLGLCPLFLIDARQVYLDNIAVPWVLGAFLLAYSPSRRQWIYAAAAVSFSVGVLSKETVLLFLPALAYVVWTRAYRPIRAMSMTGFAVTGTLCVSVYPLFAALRNELLPGRTHVSLWTNGLMYQLATRKGSGALWQGDSARHQLLMDWLGWDRLLLLGGAAACVAALVMVPRLRPAAMCFALWALPVLKPGGYLPAMYVIAVLPFAALLVAGCLDAAQNTLAEAARPGLSARMSQLTRSGGSTVAACVALSVAVLASTVYLPHVRRLLSDGSNASSVTRSVERFVEAHATHRDNILVDDSYWTDFVRAGYPEPWHGVISYYKFDLDSVTSAKELPQGWQDISYAVVTQEMRSNVTGGLGLPKLAAVIAHSSVVASFGTGQDAVQVRRVQPTAYNDAAGGAR